jgi:predicted metalloprotease
MRAKTSWVVIMVAIVLTAGACGASGSGRAPASQSVSASRGPQVTINGNPVDPVNEIVIEAITDLQRYWTAEFPKLYGGDYTPVTGGFYSVTPSSGDLPPCAEQPSDIAGNAFYCAKADVVAWDSEGLLPDLRKRFGDFVIPIVLAHEWGHAIQARAKFSATKTVTKEIQADCFAGAWAADVVAGHSTFHASIDDLDNALAGFLSLRDEPGTQRNDPSAHGSGFDRVNSFQSGLDHGPETCKTYTDDDPAVLELPFDSEADAAENGNAPYDQVTNLVPADLEDYWNQVYPKMTGHPWTPLHPAVGFDPAQPPTCGGAPTTDYSLFYCVPEDYIGYDTLKEMPAIYAQGGDFAVATLLATQYGLAVNARDGDTSDAKTGSLRADCFAGAWAASVFLQDRPDSSIKMSPGDLDKALSALLIFRGPGDEARQGAGSTRIEAYRTGLINGVSPCTTLDSPK